MQRATSIPPKKNQSVSYKVLNQGKNAFFGPVIQPKLTINPSNDSYEQEADAVADSIMQTKNENTPPSFFKPVTSSVQRKCEHCEEEEKKMQRKEINNEETAGADIENYVDNLSNGGQSLSGGVRNFYESRMGHDFSNVKVHTDSIAAKSAQSINALAYTSGNNIVFNSGQYSPDTDSGKKLLGHELTHVIQQGAALTNSNMVQRQGAGGGAAVPAKTYPFSVTYDGCDDSPYTKAVVEAAVMDAFVQVRDSNCIPNKRLKEEILAEFDGLNIDCEQGKDKPCGRASRYFTHTVNIYPDAFDPGCGPLKSTILHEIIHLTEWGLFPHGELPGGCEEACFPGFGSGDASKCTTETGFVPVLGAGGGVAFAGDGVTTKYARFYVGLDKRGPILSFVHPFFGVGVGLIGETVSGGPNPVTSGSSTLVTLLGGLRFDPGDSGGGYISFAGGPSVAISNGRKEIGAEAGAALGYRWRWLDVSVDAGYNYDPTREAGMSNLFTLGASIKISTGAGE